MKRLKRWLNQWLAKYVVLNHEEWGGMLHDYANGNWVLIHRWQGENWQEVSELLENMWNRGEDAIYICTIKVGPKDGYFVVTDSNRSYAARFFWHGIYDASDALKDVSEYCRGIADKMGFRRPENTEGVQS